MRTFVAIDIPNEINRHITALLETLKPATASVRWVRPEGLHLTLKFLGEIPPAKVEEVTTALASVRLTAPLRIQIRGAGYFPNEHAPRVIWLGMDGGTELAELADQVEETLSQLGIPKENRPFAAHLTLGRLRIPEKIPVLRELLRQREPLELGSFTAEEFFLYESKLSPGGSQYRKIARFPIAARAPEAGNVRTSSDIA